MEEEIDGKTFQGSVLMHSPRHTLLRVRGDTIFTEIKWRLSQMHDLKQPRVARS